MALRDLSLRITSLIAVFSLFDLLIMPRLNVGILLPSSMFLVLFVVPLNGVKKDKFYILLSIFLIISLSIFAGLVVNDIPSSTVNILRGLQFILVLFYSIDFIEYNYIEYYLRIVLKLFFVWILYLLIIFFSDPFTYYTLSSSLYPDTIEYLDYNIATLRFGYAFSDPNSAAYIISAALFLYVVIERNYKLVTLGMLIGVVAILSTQSRGGLVCLFVVIIYLFNNLKKFKYKVGFIFITVVILIISYIYFGDYILDFNEVAMSRLDLEDEVGGGRMSKYLYFVSNFNFLPVGMGYTLFKNGYEFRPHSDIIRMNLSYGIFMIPLFFYFFFPKVKCEVYFFLLILVPLAVNTLVDDFRLFGVALLIFSFLRAKYSINFRP
jgi:hypothetical protein